MKFIHSLEQGTAINFSSISSIFHPRFNVGGHCNLIIIEKEKGKRGKKKRKREKYALFGHCSNAPSIFHFRVLERCTKMSVVLVPRSAERRSAVSTLQPLPRSLPLIIHPIPAGTRTIPYPKR